MQSDRFERISERAYQIWVAEGRVDGRHDEHWHRAEREIAQEELRVAAALAERATDAAKTRRRRPQGASSGASITTGASPATPQAPARGRRAPTRASSS